MELEEARRIVENMPIIRGEKITRETDGGRTMDKIIAAAKVAAALVAAWLVSALAPFGIDLPADVAEGFFTAIFVGGASLLLNFVLGWFSKKFPALAKLLPSYEKP